MDNNLTDARRSKEHIISDLVALTQKEGFTYTFCCMVLTNLWPSPDEYSKIDWNQRLNHQELSFLLGLMVKNPLELVPPISVQTVGAQANDAFRLLVELHKAHTFSESGVEEDSTKDFLSWVKGGLGMIEPIFYGEEGAYEFQYLEMAEKRYKNDKEWIREHVGTSLESVIDIARQLQLLAHNRTNSLNSTLGFADWCVQLLSAFSFSPEDLTDIDPIAVNCLLGKFTLTPGKVNKDLNSLGAYNKAHSHPIIHLDSGDYFLPIFFYLAKSIYESPYYWISTDSEYKDVGLRNRGSSTEELAYDLLISIFGSHNVYRDVKVKSHNKDATDIDVLVIFGNKAIIVQVKSKKLTYPSRRGLEDSLKQDFNKAIQDPYKQALVAREAILGNESSLLLQNAAELRLAETVDEAYIICVTGEHYPALVDQMWFYFEKGESDPDPIAISVFDLDILASYLSDPFELLQYLRLRLAHAEYFRPSSEMASLSLYLLGGYRPAEDFDSVNIAQDFSQLIQADFPVKQGYRPNNEASNHVFKRATNQAFLRLMNDVKKTPGSPRLTDAIFLLYDLDESQIDDLIKGISRIKKATLSDAKGHDIVLALPKYRRGITFVSYPEAHIPGQYKYFQEHSRALAIARKYKSYANEWLVLASIAGNAGSFDFLWYAKEEWKFDLDLANLAEQLLGSGKAINSSARKRSYRVGRNASCPCGSGQKFKRCHG